MAVKPPPIKSPFEPLRFPDGPISPDMLRQNFDRIKEWASSLAVHIQTNYVTLPTASTPAATTSTPTPNIIGDPGVASMGAEGEDGAMGPPGLRGLDGAQGRPGAPGGDGEDGQDGLTVPGAAGATGATGAIGAPGPTGLPIWGNDGEDGSDAFVRGSNGANGGSGAAGSAGATGPSGLPIWGNDGEDGADAFVRGADGQQGGTGAIGPPGASGPPWFGDGGEDGNDAGARMFSLPDGQIAFGTGVGVRGSASLTWNDSVGEMFIVPGSATFSLDITGGAAAIIGIHVKNTTNGGTSAALQEMENSAGSLAYYGISAPSYGGFAPFNGGQAVFGGFGVPVSVFTQTAQPIIFYTNGAEVGRWLSGGGLQVANLSAGGIAKATAATGLLAIASAADVAAAITWPAATDVLVSAGTAAAPVGDSTFTFNTSLHVLAAGNAVGINGVSMPTYGSLVVGVTNNSNRDRVQFYVGGGTLGGGGTADSTLFDVNPNATVITAGVTAGIYATQRIRQITYSGTAAITESASLYIDGAPITGGGIGGGAAWALHVGAAGGVGSARFDGGIRATLLAAGGVVAADTTGSLGIAGVGGLTPAVSTTLAYYVNVAGSTLNTGAGTWLGTSTTAGNNSGIFIEYPLLFAAVTLGLSLRIITNAITGGTLNARVTRNGSTFTTLALTSGSSGTVTTGSLTVGSPLLSDRWGVEVDGTPTMTGNMIFTADLLLSPGTF